MASAAVIIKLIKKTIKTAGIVIIPRLLFLLIFFYVSKNPNVVKAAVNINADCFKKSKNR